MQKTTQTNINEFAEESVTSLTSKMSTKALAETETKDELASPYREAFCYINNSMASFNT
jgi:hypothetical protein